MRNVLILGSGRSGTSMVAGTLAQAGWFVGSRPYAPRSSNPKGFFESADVNGTNELLLSGVVPASEGLRAWQRWLACLPEGVECASSPRAERWIRRLVAHEPWCFKDPRFAYTLPVWRPHLGDAGLVCIFRDPAVTARSILKECGQEDYLASVAFDFERSLAAWNALYRRILDRHAGEGDWLFLHYEQVLTDAGLAQLERFVGAPVSREFPEEKLRRTQSDEPVPEAVARTYEELCERAGHRVGARARSTATLAREFKAHTVLERALKLVAQLRRGMTLQALAARDLEAFEAAVRRVVPENGPGLTADREYVEGRLATVGSWERVVRELGSLDVRDLEALDAPATIEALATQVAAALVELAELYAREERLERAERRLAEPWPIRSVAPRRLLVWPEWKFETLVALLQGLRETLLAKDAPALCLRHDTELDEPAEAALATLEAAYARVFPAMEAVEVLLIAEPIVPEELGRLGLAVDQALAATAGDRVREAWLVATGAKLVMLDELNAKPSLSNAR
ncbi:MAG: sulfotransferase [Planctomycetota bacterium]|nr:sulfotransferase [Planctomycetota bacterium]